MSHVVTLAEEHETFRNELASVARDGRRKWIYARQPSGRFYRARTVVSWFLLAFLFSAPFVDIGGKYLILGVTYRRWAKRLGKKKALVALGHKILVVIYRLLKDRTDYKERWTPSAAA